MDEQEQEREQEIQDAADRIKLALRHCGEFQDVVWNAEDGCINLYDPVTDHTLAVIVDWG